MIGLELENAILNETVAFFLRYELESAIRNEVASVPVLRCKKEPGAPQRFARNVFIPLRQLVLLSVCPNME